jgi:hypothetical protein
MKKIVFYPILFSIDPILLLLTGNLSVIPIYKLFPLILIIPLFAAGLFWLLNHWLKDIHHAGFVTFLTLFWFFHYGTIYQFTKFVSPGTIPWKSHVILLTLWTGVLIFLASKLVWRRIGNPQIITQFLNIVCVLITSYSIIRISADAVTRNLYHPKITQNIHESIDLSSSADKPDVYYIILDGYARGDILQEIYNFDNSAFLQELIAKGFFIATESQTNYMQTPLSLASSLNMSYISGLPKWMPDRGMLIGMIQDSQTWALFQQLGYKRVALSSGYLVTDLIDSDYYFTSPKNGKLNDLKGLLLNNSVAIVMIEQGWLEVPITHIDEAQERIRYAFTTLANVIPKIDGPKFVFAHIVAPHPPFIFNQNKVIDPDDFYILLDGRSFTAGPSVYIQDYTDQLIYINKQIIQTIDSILTNSKIPPIIIIQADHGPGAYLDIQSVENSCLRERFSILNAYYFPNSVIRELSKDTSPVNTFRILFNSFFGTNLKILDNKEYFSTWSNPYNFIDVSEKSQIPCNIP